MVIKRKFIFKFKKIELKYAKLLKLYYQLKPKRKSLFKISITFFAFFIGFYMHRIF